MSQVLWYAPPQEDVDECLSNLGPGEGEHGSADKVVAAAHLYKHEGNRVVIRLLHGMGRGARVPSKDMKRESLSCIMTIYVRWGYKSIHDNRTVEGRSCLKNLRNVAQDKVPVE